MKHKFGGVWTEQKLDALEKYLGFFPVALGNKQFNLVYIDTFAGTGSVTIETNGVERTIPGSAAIALRLRRPFDRYFFIERRRRHVGALQALTSSHPLRTRCTITHGDARDELRRLLQSLNWADTRGVLFLDPYGLQCTWDMVQLIARTRALDVFFLVSVSGLTRQAARSASAIDIKKQEALDRFLGTNEWRQALYKPPAQEDMFISAPVHQREPGVDAILQFVEVRLKSEFAHVESPALLRGPKNAVLFALYFAVSNRSEAAIRLATKVVRPMLSGIQ